jgi:hypothetical protein
MARNQEDIRTTTIKISERTRERLEHIREHKEESADTIINKILNILNVCLRSPSLAGKVLRDIEKSKKRKELLENPQMITKKKPQQKLENGNINKNSIKILPIQKINSLNQK